MIVTEFEGHIKFLTTDKLFYHIANELVVKKVKSSELSIHIQELVESELHNDSEWLSVSSWINIFITDSFIAAHYSINSPDFNDFMEKFKNLATMFKDQPSGLEISKESSTVGFAPLSIIFVTPKNDVLRFLLDGGTIDKLVSGFLDALKICNAIFRRRRNATIVAINNVYKQSDRMVYLKYTETGWKVIDILSHQSTIVSERYLVNNDFRVKKPWIVFQKNNLRKYKITSNNWVLSFDKLETLMLQPNDVSIYSNICNQNLQLAYKFYKKTILPRHSHYAGSFPQVEQQREYFDYFQLIVTAVIFAYTALEAFVNICIPDTFIIEEEKKGIKTIFSKVAIERTFTLRDKLKKVITVVLKSPDPSNEKWWSRFIELENLRNELLHTKQSSSEQRYSTLLSKKIFTIIETHTEIIAYYGGYIDLCNPELLEDFPYNFGYNNVVPGLTANPQYKRWIVDVKRHMKQAKAMQNNDRIL